MTKKHQRSKRARGSLFPWAHGPMGCGPMISFPSRAGPCGELECECVPFKRQKDARLALVSHSAWLPAHSRKTTKGRFNERANYGSPTQAQCFLCGRAKFKPKARWVFFKLFIFCRRWYELSNRTMLTTRSSKLAACFERTRATYRNAFQIPQNCF